MYLIDSHCHLDFPDFDADRSQILDRARAAGVQRLVLAAISRQYWPRLWHVVEQYEGCYGTFGLHPYFLADHRPDDLAALRHQLEQHRQHPKLCALGEIGLDWQLAGLDRPQQQFYFEEQLKLAQAFDLPVILHVRKAHAEVIATLKRIPIPRGGIIHAFNGSFEQALEYRKLGFLLGIGGAYSWPNAHKLRSLLPRLPLEQLVLETDSPDMAPAFAAHLRNSPEHLPQLCRLLAEDLLAMPAGQLANQTSVNLGRLFGWAQQS